MLGGGGRDDGDGGRGGDGGGGDVGAVDVGGLVHVNLTAAVDVEFPDDSGELRVCLQADRDVLVLQGDRGVRGSSRGAAQRGGAFQNAGQVDDARELGRFGAGPGTRGDGNLGEVSCVKSTPSLRDEVVNRLLPGGGNFGDEHALAELVPAVLLDHEVVLAVRGGDPLQAVDVLERYFVRSVVHLGLDATVRAFPFSLEHDAGGDVGLAFDDGVRSAD
mmetsp:Transcript_9192/g.34316  ORF Transcript_9192/g.34316 Transcript_9192/m.34316 type:complete len:218 (+) Transcript_9192:566-1219(+)